MLLTILRPHASSFSLQPCDLAPQCETISFHSWQAILKVMQASAPAAYQIYSCFGLRRLRMIAGMQSQKLLQVFDPATYQLWKERGYRAFLNRFHYK